MKRQRVAKWQNLKGLAKDREQWRADEKRLAGLPASQPLQFRQFSSGIRTLLREVVIPNPFSDSCDFS
jgi:hypothetical protein